MNQTQVIIGDNSVSVYALYYLSNNNYYLVYTLGETDDNDFVVLNIAKVLQEVINTENGPQPTGYLIGTTISNDEEYSIVKQDISNIIDAKQNNLNNPVTYIDPSNFSQIKIRDTKVLRLKKFIFEKIFGTDIVVEKEKNVSDEFDFEKKYKYMKDRNDQLSADVENLNNIVVNSNKKNNELTAVIEDLNNRINDLIQEKDQLTSTIENLNNKVANLSQENSQLNSTIYTLNNTANSLNQKLETIKNALQL